MKNTTEKTEFDIERLATLSQLTLSENEKRSLGCELERMLDFVSSIAELDTQNYGYNESSALDDLTPKNVFFTEQNAISPVYSRDELLKNAPSVTEGYISVPRVIKE